MGSGNEKDRETEPREHTAAEEGVDGLRDAGQRLLGQLNVRGQLFGMLEHAAQGVLSSVAKRLPEPLARPVEEEGRRALRKTTSRVREMKTEDLIELAQDQLKARPALALASLLGAGIFAGRVMRVAAADR